MWFPYHLPCICALLKVGDCISTVTVDGRLVVSPNYHKGERRVGSHNLLRLRYLRVLKNFSITEECAIQDH